MVIHITLELPTDEVALAATFRRVPGLSLVCERVVALREGPISPLVRFRGPELEPLEPALAADPTVEQFTVLGRTREETVCSVAWSEQVHMLAHLLTMNEAVLLSGTATADRWTFQMVVPHHSTLSQLDEYCTDRNLSLTVTRIEMWEPSPVDPMGLTPKQYEALATAYVHGYFAVPREIILKELAAELGITHQVLSERLRRAHHNLLQAVLRPPSTDSDAALSVGRSDDILYSMPLL